jgi:GNAT superfamily N-acetyltransferase
MTVRSIGGMPVTTRLAMKMEDALQAFAVRAVCFIGELGVPFSEEFDGHDYGATHVIACLGDEPVGAVRLRWFPPLAVTERLAVLPRFRGHGAGQILLERCRALAASRGCIMLCAHVMPHDTGYWEKQGWRRLVPEVTGNPRQIVPMGKAVDPGKPWPEVEPAAAIVLRGEPQRDPAGMPGDTVTN